MSRTDLKHWIQVWHDLQAVGNPVAWYKRLAAAYSETHRHYHNLQHLDECLREFDAARSLANQPAVVEAALWFHDAIYEPRSTTNEEDSAALAVAALAGAKAPTWRIDLVRQLILATKTHQPGELADAALLIDIDLTILGQPPSRFSEYELGVKAEYSWVPSATYAQKRTEILEGFLRRPAIYRTANFKHRYETTARANLLQATDALRTPPPDS